MIRTENIDLDGGEGVRRPERFGLWTAGAVHSQRSIALPVEPIDLDVVALSFQIVDDHFGRLFAARRASGIGDRAGDVHYRRRGENPDQRSADNRPLLHTSRIHRRGEITTKIECP